EYAIDPPVSLAPWQRKYHFICESGLVIDPRAQHAEAQDMSKWSDDERNIFRERFMITPKNFTSIASYMERKSVADCIHYYYMSKKALGYKNMVKRHNARRKRAAQTERSGGGGGSGSGTGSGASGINGSSHGSHGAPATAGGGGNHAHTQSHSPTNGCTSSTDQSASSHQDGQTSPSIADKHEANYPDALNHPPDKKEVTSINSTTNSFISTSTTTTSGSGRGRAGRGRGIGSNASATTSVSTATTAATMISNIVITSSGLCSSPRSGNTITTTNSSNENSSSNGSIFTSATSMSSSLPSIISGTQANGEKRAGSIDLANGRQNVRQHGHYPHNIQQQHSRPPSAHQTTEDAIPLSRPTRNTGAPCASSHSHDPLISEAIGDLPADTSRNFASNNTEGIMLNC
ncbi:unnamed protein product, partial [Protopolystoma xenopodis]